MAPSTLLVFKPFGGVLVAAASLSESNSGLSVQQLITPKAKTESNRRRPGAGSVQVLGLEESGSWT